MLELLSILGAGAGALLAIAAMMYCIAHILVVCSAAFPRAFDAVAFAVAFLGCSLFVGLLVLGY